MPVHLPKPLRLSKRRGSIIALVATSLAGAGIASPAGSQAVPWASAPTTRVVSEAVNFDSHGTRLAGTLTRPDVAGLVPVAIVLHDASLPLGNSHLYDHLKAMLPALGIAVFSYDRRGSGASGGTDTGGGMDQRAEDGIAAAKMLRSNAHIDPSRVGFWGLSQGGWLALLAASRWPQAAFAVSVSAPITTADVQMNYLVANKLHIEGYSQPDVDEAIAVRLARDRAARGQLDVATAKAKVDSARSKVWFSRIYMGSPITPENLARWRSDINLDPLKSLGVLMAPTLIIYGSVDPVVPVAASVARLSDVTRRHPNVEVAVIAGADHSMMTSRTPTQQMDENLNSSRTADSPEYLGRLATWLQREVVARRSR